MGSNFILMNKDTMLGSVSVNRNRIDVNYYDNSLRQLFNNPSDWIINRAGFIGRSNIIDIFKMAGIDTLEEYMRATHCVSATDTFWFKLWGEHGVTWKDVSVFNNRISRLIANAAIDGAHLLGNANAKSPSPQYNVAGSADKCIKRVDKKLMLYKSSGIAEFGMNVRPYMEAIVTQVAKAIGFETVVEYTIEENFISEAHCYKPYCVCGLVTNEQVGLVNYCDSLYHDVRLDVVAKQMRDNSDNIGLQRLREMMVLDSICLNIDRHDENYAFEFDTDTLKLRTFSRAYDFDCSFGATLPILSKCCEDDYKKLMNIGPKTWSSFDAQAVAFASRPIYDKLKRVGAIRIDFDKMHGLSRLRRELVEYIVNRRIKEIVALIDKRLNR